MINRVYTEFEAAQYLKTSHHTLRKQRSDGEISNGLPLVPFIKMGRSVRYLKEDLDQYLDNLKEEQNQRIGSNKALNGSLANYHANLPVQTNNTSPPDKNITKDKAPTNS